MRELFIVCVLAACGSSNAKPDAAMAQDSRSIDAASLNQGVVTLLQGYDGAENTGQATAGFVMGNVFGTPVATDGPCGLNGSASTMVLDAGAITVTGTASPVTLDYGGSPAKYEASPTPPYPLFTAGATITVTAAGGAGVAGFTGTVTGPANVAGFTRPTTMSRAGYTLTWTAGAGPGMWVLIAGVDDMFDSSGIVCMVPDTGTFAIPASTFALLPAADTMGGVAIVRVAQTEVTDSDGTKVYLIGASQDSSTIIPLTD
ncbi:MAG TPA: hypothetical protein VGF94_00245 [Kofleriaceae bacterium]|jgi:hypothetical protein